MMQNLDRSRTYSADRTMILQALQGPDDISVRTLQSQRLLN